MFNEELITAKVAARNAGKILIKHLNVDDKNIEYKSEDSPVTIADHETDRYLFDFIGGEFPHDGWLSEETVDTEERLEKKRTWIVDPLDGTKEYIKKLPEFSISIALVENNIPVVGVIYNPISEEMFWAERNKGAFLNGMKIQISNKKDIKDASLIVSRSEYGNNLWNNYKSSFSSIKSIGSIGAGDCIVREAGGTMKTINGENMDYNQKKTLVTDPIIATNFKLFDMVSDLLY